MYTQKRMNTYAGPAVCTHIYIYMYIHSYFYVHMYICTFIEPAFSLLDVWNRSLWFSLSEDRLVASQLGSRAAPWSYLHAFALGRCSLKVHGAHIYVHIQICKCVCNCICMYMYLYMYMHMNMYMDMFIYACIPSSANLGVYMNIYIYIQAFMLLMCECIHVRRHLHTLYGQICVNSCLGAGNLGVFLEQRDYDTAPQPRWRLKSN